ncbi:tRNA methyltransferase 112-like [Papilio machaon]|uniref:Multifunctional methyltransferase subunit TRM112-like protein n=1 Tax=Papilio machaon TaxID=76193 RepID=A0A194RH80_PAPMA|nr:multifunctional methyltransferase subunit TRM112-like protein [Papilio machaon]KPJ07138.1 tRNA methyltransferase 112-like [Papilio machaon]KPJ16799.1 tRNA methyltransferase 112-like [Papilio machaon]
MKLITHNMLTSKCLKGVITGYPLAITATVVKVSEVEYNPEFISRIIPKLDWEVLWKAADSIGHNEGLPQTIDPKFEDNEEFLRKAHKVLLEVEVEEGYLTCPESGRQFPITKGIPNMLLTEAEVQ